MGRLRPGVVGQLLRELVPGDQHVLSTEISAAMGPHPNQGGLSRKHVMEGVDACLRRFGLDYVDQLIIPNQSSIGTRTADPACRAG